MGKPKIQNKIKLVKFLVPKTEMELKGLTSDDFSEDLKIDIEFGVGFNEEMENIYSNNFKIKINSTDNSFKIKLEAIAFFETSNKITTEFLESPFVKINSPAIAFPFIRSYVNTITSNAGLEPIILPSYNFSE